MKHTHSLLTETRESLATKLAASFSAANPGIDADTAAAKAQATLDTVHQLLMKRSGLAPANMPADKAEALARRTVYYFHNCHHADGRISLPDIRGKMLRTINDTKYIATHKRGVTEEKAEETSQNSRAAVEALGLPERHPSRSFTQLATRPTTHRLR